MEPVQIDWNSAQVSGSEGTFDLEVRFVAPSSPAWWESFSRALEQVSRENLGARWQVIRGIDEPPSGLFVGGIVEDSVTPLRGFLDNAVSRGNREFNEAVRARKIREADADRRASEQERTAERMTQAFRRGSVA